MQHVTERERLRRKETLHKHLQILHEVQTTLKDLSKSHELSNEHLNKWF